MLVYIRVDASNIIGSGHVMRCLTLAERLRFNGAEVSFICRDFPGNLAEYINSSGFKVHLLPNNKRKLKLDTLESKYLGTSITSDAEETIQVLQDYHSKTDWIIVDHYALDCQWESFLRKWTHKMMVIDDLANRKHDCDILLDQNYYRNLSDRYKGLVSKECTLLLGPRYLLLRDEFYITKRNIKIRNGKVSNILIFYGGADATNETEKCLRVLCNFNSQFEINVVVGRSNPTRKRIEEICSSMVNTHYYCQISDMAELINKADLAFGAGGSAMWERCFLGLPSIVTITADNQRETTQAAADLGVVYNLGWYTDVNDYKLNKVVQEFLNNRYKLYMMYKKLLNIFTSENRSVVDHLISDHII